MLPALDCYLHCSAGIDLSPCHVLGSGRGPGCGQVNLKHSVLSSCSLEPSRESKVRSKPGGAHSPLACDREGEGNSVFV